MVRNLHTAFEIVCFTLMLMAFIGCGDGESLPTAPEVPLPPPVEFHNPFPEFNESSVVYQFNEPPVIDQFIVPGMVSDNDRYHLHVIAHDADGDTLTYSWALTVPGQTDKVFLGNKPTVAWKAVAGTRVTVEVRVSDQVHPPVIRRQPIKIR
ncbi:MAG: hypothetical protein O7E52_02675 [Candidatus Poribacteria bacterium]|nr:hypothetical protein [Candidatus Poribacteria bacterium]